MKKIITLFLSLLFSAGITLHAQEIGDKFRKGALYYKITNLSPAEVFVDYQLDDSPHWNEDDQPKGDITIPSTITYIGKTYTVVGINAAAFSECHDITSVDIPATIKRINHRAFWQCIGLASINIASTDAYLEGEIFNGTLWWNRQYAGILYIDSYLIGYKGTMPPNTSLTIKEGITVISGLAFREQGNLASITLPQSLLYINHQAFYMCNGLTTLHIPKNVIEISSHYSIHHCNNLSSITVDPSNLYYKSVDGILFSKDMSKLCIYPTAKSDASYTVPASVKIIDKNAFYYNEKITSLILSEGLEIISESAFMHTKISNDMTLPSSVNFIGEDAFRNVRSQSLVIKSPNLTIKKDAFSMAYLSNIYMYAPIPPVGNYTLFRSPYNVTLHVPIGSKSKYENATLWKNMKDIIEENLVTNFPLYVAGVQVTTANSHDILEDGTVSYDHKTATVTLNNANITNGYMLSEGMIVGIYSELKKELTIESIGENSIKLPSQKNMLGIVTNKPNANINIVGDGALFIETISTHEDPLMVAGVVKFFGDVTVSVKKLVIHSLYFGISATNITIENESHVEISAGEIALSVNQEEGTLSVYANATTKAGDNKETAVEVSADQLAGKKYVSVEPAPAYPLYIDGIQVNKANETDVLNDGGSVSYNNETTTLTLNNANITTGYIWVEDFIVGIFSDLEKDITIELIGKNSIILPSAAAMFGIFTNQTSNSNINIVGDGALYIETISTHEDPFFVAGIYFPSGDIAISANEIAVKSSYAGMGAGTNINIENKSHVEISAGEIALSVNQEEGTLSVYTNATIKAGNNKETAVEVSADQLAGKKYVSIKPNGTGIDHLSANKHTFNSWSTHGVLHIALSKSLMQQANRESLLIYNLLGSSLYNAELSYNYYQIPMKPGVYIIRIGDNVQKVVVR